MCALHRQRWTSLAMVFETGVWKKDGRWSERENAKEKTCEVNLCVVIVKDPDEKTLGDF